MAASVFTITAMSIDRYLAIRSPMAFRRVFNRRSTVLVIIALWLVALGIFVPVLRGVSKSLGSAFDSLISQLDDLLAASIHVYIYIYIYIVYISGEMCKCVYLCINASIHSRGFLLRSMEMLKQESDWRSIINCQIPGGIPPRNGAAERNFRAVLFIKRVYQILNSLVEIFHLANICPFFFFISRLSRFRNRDKTGGGKSRAISKMEVKRKGKP